jgi:hypothetical protein
MIALPDMYWAASQTPPSAFVESFDRRSLQLPSTLASSLQYPYLVDHQPLVRAIQASIYMISNNPVAQQHLDIILDFLDWIVPVATLRQAFQLKTPAAEDFSATISTAAVDRGRLSVVRALLSAGVSQNTYRSRTSGMETALAASVLNQDLDVVK